MRSDGAFHLTDFAAWRGCDHRYSLEVIGKAAPAFRSPAALAGTAIHRVRDAIHAESLWDASRFTLAERWHQAWQWAVEHPVRPEERDVPIWWGDYEDETLGRDALCLDAMPMLEGYAADARNRDAFVLAQHSKWRAEIAGAPWAGEIDRIDVLEDGTAVVVDLKSGKERPAGPAMELWTQLAYAIAVERGEFLHVTDDGDVWKPLNLVVRKVVWLHLRDYVPYEKVPAARKADYVKGTPRGPVYYETTVNDKAFAAMEREMALFVEAVGRGVFPRRPSNYQCGICKVAERCLADYRGPLDPGSLNVTEGLYAQGIE